jgi:hypothetical protein
MEMPDRFTDFTFENDSKFAGSIDNITKTSKLTGVAMPSVTKHYQKMYFKWYAAPNLGNFESAECLYMIIAYGLQDQEALERFSESEIADSDGDGLPEFIDAWGRPIAFMRWAPLFDSTAQTTDPAKHHDPFDPMKQDVAAYALYPVIYSGGPDKIYDINETTRAATLSNKPFDSSSTLAGAFNDQDSDGEDNSKDNITNHELLVP